MGWHARQASASDYRSDSEWWREQIRDPYEWPRDERRCAAPPEPPQPLPPETQALLDEQRQQLSEQWRADERAWQEHIRRMDTL